MPKTVRANSPPFKNFIYSYDLGQAMADGFVKEAPVATRKDFDLSSVDAVHYNDHVAVELDRYYRITGRPLVRPFILVVAQDTDHAERIRAFIESKDFFEARHCDWRVAPANARRANQVPAPGLRRDR